MAVIYRDTTQAYNVDTKPYTDLASMGWAETILGKIWDPITSWIDSIFSGFKGLKETAAGEKKDQNAFFIESDGLYYNDKNITTLLVVGLCAFIFLIWILRKNK